MIYLPYQNFHRVYASVQDCENTYQLFITNEGLEVPGTEPMIPDIMVKNGEHTRLFAMWNNQYWKQLSETKGSEGYYWTRRLVLVALCYKSERNGNSTEAAIKELVDGDPCNISSKCGCIP